jgi:hypothetical protein
MTRQITYSVASEWGGRYNNTFLWGNLQKYLDFMSRYWDIQFVRVNANGRIKIHQAGTNPGATVAAWTNIPIFTMRISPTFNFAQNNYYCAKVLCHEFLHMPGGASHLPGNVAVMSVYGGTAGNFTQEDYRYMQAYAWKSALRPHTEPNAMAQAFTAVRASRFEEEPDPLVFGCDHQELPWYKRILPATFRAP